MSRDITTAVDNAAQAEHLVGVTLVHMDFVSGDVYANDSVITIPYGGNDYLGVGDLGSVDVPAESAGLQANALTLSLSGIPSNYIAISFDPSEYRNRAATVYLALLDVDSHQLINDPVILFKGKMDTMAVERGETCTITVTVQSPLVDWQRNNVRRYTHEDQLAEYPNDLGLEFVARSADAQIRWGR